MIALIAIALSLALGLLVHHLQLQHPRNSHRHFGGL